MIQNLLEEMLEYLDSLNLEPQFDGMGNQAKGLYFVTSMMPQDLIDKINSVLEQINDRSRSN